MGDPFYSMSNGQKVKASDLKDLIKANKMILSSSAKYKYSRSAYKALKDGHMSDEEASDIQSEVENKKTGGVKSLGEHWNARFALNKMYSKEAMKNPSPENLEKLGFELQKPGKTAYHGPTLGIGAKKYVNPKTGAEIVFDAQGKMETRVEYMGTFNYGRPGSNRSHYSVDMIPYQDSGNMYGDNTPLADRMAGQGVKEGYSPERLPYRIFGR